VGSVSEKGRYSSRPPYTDEEEATTSRRRSASRAASRTFSVPSTFTSSYSRGASTLGRTPAFAA